MSLIHYSILSPLGISYNITNRGFRNACKLNTEKEIRYEVKKNKCHVTGSGCSSSAYGLRTGERESGEGDRQQNRSKKR